MLEKAVSDVDRMSGIVAYAGGRPKRAVRSGAMLPGDVVLLDMDKFHRDEAAFLKPERRWVVLKETAEGEILLSQATTKETLAGQGLPGLQIELSRTTGFYAGFDNPQAIIHPALFRKFKKSDVLGKVGSLGGEDWKAFQAGLDAGLGLGTGAAGSPGSGRSRRGTIWRHKNGSTKVMLMACHEYSLTDGAPMPVVPLLDAEEGQEAPEDAVVVSDALGKRYFAFPGEISLSRAGTPGASRDWYSDNREIVAEHSAQELDGALFDWLKLHENPSLKRPVAERRAFSMRRAEARNNMGASGHFNAVPAEKPAKGQKLRH